MKSTSSKSNNSMMIASLRYILLLAVAARVLLPLLATIATEGNALFQARDSSSYIQTALALITDGDFARWGLPELIRTPGYPLLLVPGIALGYMEPVTIALQIVLSLATVVLVYRIAFLLFERIEIAILSALLFALEPISILYSSKLMSETLFTALIALFLYLLVRYWKERSVAHLALSAVALAAATYVRPIAYYIPILVFILLLVWALTIDRKDTRRLVHLFIFLLISIGLIGLWQIRNRIETGYSGFSAAVEHSLYFWDAASVLAVGEGISLNEMQDQMGLSDDEVYFQNFPDQRGWEKGEIFASMGKEGKAIVLGNLDTYSVLVLNGLLRNLMDPAATEYLRMFRIYPEEGGLLDLINDRGLIKAVAYLYEEIPIVFWANLLLSPIAVMYPLLALVGIAKSREMFLFPTVVFFGLTAYFLIVSAAGLGTNRARHPVMPMICVFAGYGLFWILDYIRTRWYVRREGFIRAISNSTQ